MVVEPYFLFRLLDTPTNENIKCPHVRISGKSYSVIQQGSFHKVGNRLKSGKLSYPYPSFNEKIKSFLTPKQLCQKYPGLSQELNRLIQKYSNSKGKSYKILITYWTDN